MTGKGFAWITLVYIIGVLLGSSFDMYGAPGSAYSWALSSSQTAGGYVAGQAPTTLLEYLLNFSNAVQHLSVGPVAIPWINTDYFSKVFHVLLLDFSFSPMGSLQWILICSWISVIGVYTIVTMILSAIRGNITWG